MNDDDIVKIRWNIFVRELFDVLESHSFHVRHLSSVIGLHPELVRRLQKSLYSPKSLVVIDPESLEKIIVSFALEPVEVARLKAALLATCIERMLMDRVVATSALALAEEMYRIILNALAANFNMLDQLR